MKVDYSGILAVCENAGHLEAIAEAFFLDLLFRG